MALPGLFSYLFFYECHGRFRSPGHNYRASQDKIGKQLYTEEFHVATIQRDCKSLTVILVHRGKSIMAKALGTR